MIVGERTVKFYQHQLAFHWRITIRNQYKDRTSGTIPIDELPKSWHKRLCGATRDGVRVPTNQGSLNQLFEKIQQICSFLLFPFTSMVPDPLRIPVCRFSTSLQSHCQSIAPGLIWRSACPQTTTLSVLETRGVTHLYGVAVPPY